MDVIFEDTAVGGLQSQQVLIPGLDGLQPVLCVLRLSLIRGKPKNRLLTKEGQKSNKNYTKTLE